MAKKKTKTSKKPILKAGKKPVKKTVKKKAKKTAVKKVSPKKPRLKKSAPVAEPLPWRHALPGETMAGVVDDYFSHLSVITLTLQSPLKVGDKIHVRGHTTDMTEILESMQIDHQGMEAHLILSVQEPLVDLGFAIDIQFPHWQSVLDKSLGYGRQRG